MKRQALFTIILLLAPGFARAETRLVPAQYPNIQAAIDDANDRDTVIVAPGLYTGPGNRDIDFLGKAITVRSTDPNDPDIVAATTIDCNAAENDQHRGFYFHTAEDPNSLLAGFTITNGLHNYGAAVLCKNSSPTIRDCRLIENESVGSDGGGGIRLANSNAIIDACIIKGNYAQYGGGITCAMQSSPTILNCLIIDNRATKDYSQGGGIYCGRECSPIITNCTLSGNTAGYASGGIYIGWNSVVHITNCIFRGNSTEIGFDTFYRNVVVSHCIVKGGFAGEANLDVDPCFADPYSGDYSLRFDSPCIDAGANEPPGGLPQTDLAGASRTIDGDNDGTALADIGAYEAALPAQPVIEISKEHFLFTATEGGPDPNAQTLTIRNRGGATLNWQIASDSSWLSVSHAAGQSTGEAHDVTLYATTAALASGRYDGHLTVSDPCSLNSPRLIAVTLYVSAQVAHVPARYPTIQEAIDYVLDAGTVVLAPGAYTGEGNRDLDFKGKAITVRSADPRDANIVATTIIDCQGTKNQPHRGFSFVSGEGRDSILDGLTITNGCAPLIFISGYSYSYGGAIHCQASSPTISRCRIVNNRTAYYRAGGAGICCYDNSSPLIDHCLIADNLDVSSSNIYNDYGGGAAIFCEKESHALVTHCTIVANAADLSAGGGIKIGWLSGATIANCIFWHNSAPLGPQIDIAGAAYDDLSVSHCDIQGGLAGISIPEGWPLDWCRYNIDADPCLVDPNAGDYHLSNFSPCINAGDPNFSPAPDLTDIDGDPRVINGRIDIGADEFDAEGPVIEISPRLFDFHAIEFGPDPQTQILTIRNSGTGALKWQVTEDCPWLSLTPTFGESTGRPNQIELAASVEALNIGRLKCKLRVFDPDAVNASEHVTVFFHIYGTAVHVPSRMPTIQDAVDYVWDAGTVIVAPGTYTGPGNRDIDFKGKAITLRSTDPNDPDIIAATIIDCNATENDQHRGFYFHSGEDVNSILDGFTIKNGLADYGAGILCSIGSNPTIVNCSISGNRAGSIWGGNGGAIACDNSSPRITRCRLTGNSAHHGGALYLSESSPTIIDCLINGNLAYAVPGVVMIPGQGPGIYCSSYRSHPIINNCTITNNYGPDGGGISCRGSSPKITNCILWDNSHPQVAGGAPDVTFCDIQGGWPGQGNIDANPCFFQPGHWNPEGATYPSGDFWVDGIYYLLPGSPCIDAGTNEPNIGLAPADIIGNPRLVDGDADAVAVVDLGAYEHAPNIPAIDVSVRQFTFRAVKGQPNPEPQVLNIANAAGGILNWRITSDCNWLSAEPNSGSSTEDLTPVLLSVDISALPAGDHFCNLKISDPDAVNSPLPAPVVLHLGNLLRVPSDYPTIQDAVDAAADCDLVLVAEGAYTGDGNRDIDFLGKSITIRSENGPANCIIDCNATESDPHRAFSLLYVGDQQSLIEGLTIRNGYAWRGGAVFCSASNLKISNCIITDNVSSEHGGAIYCDGASTVITDCIISRNHATQSGGAIFSQSGRFKLANCKAALVNCTLTGNSSPNGGCIYNSGSPLTITNSILWDNTPPQLHQDYNQYTMVTYSDVEGGFSGLGNIDADPCFVDPRCWVHAADLSTVVEPNDPDAIWIAADYHLMSAGWRWDTQRQVWTWDDVTSRCIDAGNPGSPLAAEPLSVPGDPNNQWGRNLRINMGAYGGTPEASIPPHNWSLLSDLTNDGTVDPADLAGFALDWLNYAYVAPGDLDRNAVVDFTDFALLARDWLAQTTWFGSPWPSIPPPYPPDPPPKRTCFPADTLVRARGALVPISEVLPGQRVDTYSSTSIPLYSSEVEEVQEHEGTYDCYDVVLSTGEVITVADEHYFLVDGACERWVSLHDLKPGAKLKSFDGPVAVAAVLKRPAPVTGKVYNLKIKDSDRYFVGRDAITVRDY